MPSFTASNEIATVGTARLIAVTSHNPYRTRAGPRLRAYTTIAAINVMTVACQRWLPTSGQAHSDHL